MRAVRGTHHLLFLSILFLSGLFSSSEARKKEAEPTIEDVDAVQLQKAIQDKDFLAVFWCK